MEDFQFADFKVTSQEWDLADVSKHIENGCSDNGHGFWENQEENKN